MTEEVQRMAALYPVSGTVKNYAWGKTGNSSRVAQYAALNGDLKSVDEGESYAEYWFGTHPNGPSTLRLPRGESVPMRDWLGSELPYLAKILSIRKTLSIQVHPNKVQATELHAKRPDIYKDPNHKPELAFALTDFEAMCGFRSAQEIAQFAATVPEFQAVLGQAGMEAAEQLKHAQNGSTDAEEALRKLFTAYCHCEEDVARRAAEDLAKRLGGNSGAVGEDGSAKGPSEDPSGFTRADSIAARLTKEYPGDIGVFAPFMLNCVQLSPGEAIFLSANLPHAYISGDCVEVMACSDNVVRMGCTPKLKDVPVLLSIIEYKPGLPNVMKGKPLTEGLTKTLAFVPSDASVNEFVLERTVLKAGEEITLEPADSAAIILIIHGTALVPVDGGDGQGTHSAPCSEKELTQGSASVQPPRSALRLRCGPSESESESESTASDSCSCTIVRVRTRH